MIRGYADRTRVSSPLSWRRRLAGFGLAVVGPPAVTVGLLTLRGEPSLASEVLLVLATVVAVALLGGMLPAVLAALVGFLLLNFYSTEPYRTFAIADRDNILALTVFVVVAVSVSAVVNLAARRTREAANASADAQLLATVAGSVLRGARPLTALLEQLRETFGLQSVTLLEPRDAPGGWQPLASVGEPVCTSPVDGDTAVPAGEQLALVLRGHPVAGTDRRIVEAFAAQAALAVQQERLAEEAGTARLLAASDKMRAALLTAVSHELRTPLASAMAAVASLRSDEVAFDPADRTELLSTADESLQRLHSLVVNLLDMSRLQAGVLGVTTAAVGLEDAVPRALDELGEAAYAVQVDLCDDLPAAAADPALLERILVNVLRNALRFSPADQPPVITGRQRGGSVQLHVVDRGPGIPQTEWEQVFLPFQRLGDRDNDTGVGLGLALSRGLAEAMGGTLQPQTTPGGGLTMVLSLPACTGTQVAST